MKSYKFYKNLTELKNFKTCDLKFFLASYDFVELLVDIRMPKEKVSFLCYDKEDAKHPDIWKMEEI